MMRAYRGIVCEKKKKYTVFLTENGVFLRGIPIGETPDIGDEVDFHPVSRTPLIGGKVKPRFVGAFMIAAVFLFSIVASLIPMNDKVMAYVQLETDTAVELGVNQTGNVITLHYLNDTPVEPGNSLVGWKGYSINKVLDMAVKKLSTESSGVQVNITIISQNAKSQHKVQRIVGNAVREVRSANKELTIEIGESTAEERVMANEHEMSVHKFKDSQQVSPKNEKNPSIEVDHDMEKNSVNQQREKDAHKNSVKQSIPTVPSNEKNNGNENLKESNELKDPKLRKPDTKPNKEQDEKFKYSPAEKGKSTYPESERENSNKGNQNPVSKQLKENKNQQKQPGTANDHGKQAHPIVGNDGK